MTTANVPLTHTAVEAIHWISVTFGDKREILDHSGLNLVPYVAAPVLARLDGDEGSSMLFAVAPPMEPEMHYTRTFLFAAEVVHRSWAVYFLFISSYIHKLFSTFITFVGHNRSIHQF